MLNRFTKGENDMSDTITPPVELPQEEAPLIRWSFPKPKSVVVIVLVALLAAAGGVAVAASILLGSAHGATGQAQAQFRASQSQLHATQGQLSTSQANLSASQAALSAQQGSAVVGTWTGTDTSGWSGTMTINADHSFTFNGVENGTVENSSGIWSVVTPGTLLIVEPSNSNLGDVFNYTISGNTITYTESDSNATTTLTR